MSNSDNSSEEKTFPASKRKLRELRKKGQIPKSNDMVAAATTTSAMLFLWLSGGRFVEEYRKSIIAIEHVDTSNFDFAATSVAKILALNLGFFVVALILVVLPMMFLANFLINRGFLFSLDPIRVDLNRLNPVEGLKRLFSLKSLIEIGKNLVKISVFLSLSLIAISFQINAPFNVPFCGLDCVRTTFVVLLSPILLIAIIVLLSFGIADIGIQRWLFLREQRMTKTEVRRERKEEEGSPELRSFQRRGRQRILGSKYSRNDATMFVEGTTAIVGIHFIRGETPVPVLVCKGKGKRFAELADFAIENRIPTYADEDLAVGIYQKLEPGSPLTEAFFEPIIRALKALGLV